jgi:CheY-like chemotaxis protein
MARILVIDDEATTRVFLEALFKKTPHDIKIYESWTKAFPILSTGDYNLLLLDLMMPGFSGEDIAQMVQRRPTKAKVILFSAASKDKLIELAAKPYFDGYVQKGMAPRSLIQKIVSFL